MTKDEIIKTLTETLEDIEDYRIDEIGYIDDDDYILSVIKETKEEIEQEGKNGRTEKSL